MVGVIGILFLVGLLEIVPVVSKRGVCFGTPTVLTVAENW